MEENTNTAVTVRENTLPAEMDAIAEDAGLGLDQLGIDDIAIPFLKLLQDISSEVKKRHENHVEGAEPGMIYDEMTGVLHDGTEGLVVLPVYVEPSYVEWFVPDGGGSGQFRGKHPNETPLIRSCTKGPKGENILPNGNQLVRTMHVYVLVENADGTWDQRVLSMARSQLKKAKKWNRDMKGKTAYRSDGTPFKAPSFLFKWRLATRGEVSAKGDDYFNWVITEEGMLDLANEAALYATAREFADGVKAGTIQAAPEGGAEEEDSKASEDIPF